ncbi:MAG: CRISPR-associated endonuclease Cas1, partial [Bacteroidetes bacterium]
TKVMVSGPDAARLIDRLIASRLPRVGRIGLAHMLNRAGRIEMEVTVARPAEDAFNAFLNYGYGVLYSRVEKALMIAGLDPYLGFMHRDDYNQRSMVYDFIEPYRVWIDKVVFGLFARKHIRESHYEALTRGVSLVKGGKEVLLAALLDYLDERKIRYRGRQLNRGHALQLDAHRFAQQLIGRAATDWTTLEV